MLDATGHTNGMSMLAVRRIALSGQIRLSGSAELTRMPFQIGLPGAQLLG